MIMNLRSDEMSGDCSNFRVRHPCCIDRITSISKMQSDTTFNIYIAKRCFYIAYLNNETFRPQYRPSSGDGRYNNNNNNNNTINFQFEIMGYIRLATVRITGENGLRKEHCAFRNCSKKW